MCGGEGCSTVMIVVGDLDEITWRNTVQLLKHGVTPALLTLQMQNHLQIFNCKDNTRASIYDGTHRNWIGHHSRLGEDLLIMAGKWRWRPPLTYQTKRPTKQLHHRCFGSLGQIRFNKEQGVGRVSVSSSRGCFDRPGAEIQLQVEREPDGHAIYTMRTHYPMSS